MKKPVRKFVCTSCSRSWEEPYGTGRPQACPLCGSARLGRANGDRTRPRTCSGRRRPKRW